MIESIKKKIQEIGLLGKDLGELSSQDIPYAAIHAAEKGIDDAVTDVLRDVDKLQHPTPEPTKTDEHRRLQASTIIKQLTRNAEQIGSAGELLVNIEPLDPLRNTLEQDSVRLKDENAQITEQLLGLITNAPEEQSTAIPTLEECLETSKHHIAEAGKTDEHRRLQAGTIISNIIKHAKGLEEVQRYMREDRRKGAQPTASQTGQEADLTEELESLSNQLLRLITSAPEEQSTTIPTLEECLEAIKHHIDEAGKGEFAFTYSSKQEEEHLPMSVRTLFSDLIDRLTKVLYAEALISIRAELALRDVLAPAAKREYLINKQNKAKDKFTKAVELLDQIGKGCCLPAGRGGYHAVRGVSLLSQQARAVAQYEENDSDGMIMPHLARRYRQDVEDTRKAIVNNILCRLNDQHGEEWLTKASEKYSLMLSDIVNNTQQTTNQ